MLKIHIKRGIRVKKVIFVKCAFVFPKMPVKYFRLLKKMMIKLFKELYYFIHRPEITNGNTRDLFGFFFLL